MSEPAMRDFWDAAADENALYYIDNRLGYRATSEREFWAGGEAALDLLLNAVGISVSPEDDVVEIGCGIGRLTHVLSRRAASVRALDVSPQMIARGRRHGAGLANVEWLVGDGTSLAPIADGSADACISQVVFQHIPDPEVTLGYVREIGRVLRPGGWAAFQISNDPTVHRRRSGREALSIWVRAKLGRGPAGQTDPAWLGSAVTMEALGAATADGGMEIERVSGQGTQFCFVLTRRLP